MLKQLIASAANGYILMYFSEHVFWARVRPEDSLGDWISGWLVYSLAGYLLLALIATARVRTIWALFLAGAVFGWLVEGVFVQTTYEALPLSVSWTALAWHALFSVWVGWYAVRRALGHSVLRTALWAGAIGLGYGLWAITWWLEPGLDAATPEAFAGFAFATTGLWILAHGIFNWAAPALRRPNRVLTFIVSALFVAYFAFVAVPAAPVAIGVLPILLALAAFGLWANRRISGDGDLLVSAPIPLRRYLSLVMVPISAVLVYALADAFGWQWHTNWIVYLITTPLGFLLFGVAIYAGWRRGRAALPQNDSGRPGSPVERGFA